MAYVLLAVVIVSTAVCYHQAKRKGLNLSLWIVLGALFGPLAIPFVYAAADRNRPIHSDPAKGDEHG